MGLYGLDFIPNRDELILSEINGICSGMSGFEKVYGDNRVKQRVWNILSEKYDCLTVNDGSYQKKIFKESHPLLSLLAKILYRDKYHLPRILRLPKSEAHWINETAPNMKDANLNFPVYSGQDSTVINIVNNRLPHSLVNNYVAEEITRNKFLQYMVLKNSEVDNLLPDSTFVGLGITNKRDIKRLIETYSHFFIKPIMGSCGKGGKLLSKEGIEKYLYDDGFIKESLFNILSLFMENDSSSRTVKDLVNKKDFDFEWGISIIQPFIESRENNSAYYKSIRAIVCENQFIDAYLRESKSPQVNMSQNAMATEFKRKGFGNLCEKIVNIFEAKCKSLDSQEFRTVLYNKYFDMKPTNTTLDEMIYTILPFAKMH